MGLWRVILDVITPGTPKHKASITAMRAETLRLNQLLEARRHGAVLHPMDEITLTTHEVLAGFGETEQ